MSDLIIRRIDNDHVAQLKDLWLSAFPSDPIDFVDGFFAHLPQGAVTMVGENDGKAVTMLFLLPAAARFRGETYPVRYLYAGCTHPQYRGRGYYRELMSAAAQTVAAAGEHAVYLHPADEKLIATYQRLGYRAGIFGGEHIQPKNALPACHTVDEYIKMRDNLVARLSDNMVVWNTAEDVTRFFVTDAVARGATMLGDKDRVALLFDDTVVELIDNVSFGENKNYCLWLPIGDTPLLALMEEYEGFTGLVGD